MKTILSTITLAAFLTAGAAFADTVKTDTANAPKPQASTSATTPKANGVATIQSEKSKKCSDEANAKNLHGKERKAFRKACMKAA